MTARRRVFVRFGFLVLGIGLVGATLPGAANERNIASALFGLTGTVAYLAALLVLAPAFFVVGGCVGLLGRMMFVNTFEHFDHTQRETMLRKMIDSERRFPWVPNVFFLFEIDHHGRPIK